MKLHRNCAPIPTENTKLYPRQPNKKKEFRQKIITIWQLQLSTWDLPSLVVAGQQASCHNVLDRRWWVVPQQHWYNSHRHRSPHNWKIKQCLCHPQGRAPCTSAQGPRQACLLLAPRLPKAPELGYHINSRPMPGNPSWGAEASRPMWCARMGNQ